MLRIVFSVECDETDTVIDVKPISDSNTTYIETQIGQLYIDELERLYTDLAKEQKLQQEATK